MKAFSRRFQHDSSDGGAKERRADMIPTLIGIPLILVAFVLLFAGSLQSMFLFTTLMSLLGGSAAVILTALGNSSIPPLQFVLPFFVARILLPGSGLYHLVGESMRANIALFAFTAYGLIMAYVGPRIFAHHMMVAPLRFAGLTYLFDVVDLVPSGQNVTTAVYMVGTLLLALSVYVTCKAKGSEHTLVTAAVIVSFIHAGSGLAEIAVRGTPLDLFFTFFRNGTYAQLEQSYGVFSRMSGFFPEASAYSAFAFIWFVFMFECWYAGVRPRATGLSAVALAGVLVFSTSASAYASMAGYAAIFLLRMLLVPQSVKLSSMLYILGGAFAALLLAGLFAVFIPKFANSFSDMILHMTVEKSTSSSGLQRLFWATKGIEAFRVSNGLGIGPGSFRSSSLATAILGSVGIIGVITFVIYLAQVFMPLRATTYIPQTDQRQAIGVAASWTAVVGLIPQSIAAPSCDPGLTFAIFTGAALALRGFGIPRAAAVFRTHRMHHGSRQDTASAFDGLTQTRDLPLV
jgi:hypothetical protein